MKILFCSPSWWPQVEYGGPIIACKRLSEELVHIGHGVAVSTYWMNLRAFGKFSLELPLVLHYEIKPDVVYLLGTYNASTLPVLWYCRRYRKPLVWSPRGALQRWSGTRHRWLKALWHILCRWVAPPWIILHCTSEMEAKETAAVFSWPIRIVPNGVDVPEFLEHVPRDAMMRLLYVGRLNPKKNLDVLIRTCAGMPVQLRLVGDGPRSYVKKLRQCAEDAVHVEFVGPVPHHHLSEYFANTDVTVLPSATENFGNVIAESLAHGVPVLASRACPLDLLTHECGLRVEPKRDSLLVAIMLLHYMDLKTMGERGRHWMQQDFRWEHRAKEMVEAFEFARERCDGQIA